MYKELIKQLDNLQDRNMLLNRLLIDIIFSCKDMDIEIQAVKKAKKILFKSNKKGK